MHEACICMDIVIDIDECSVNNSWLCHGGTCMNTVGSFMCRCRPGYQLVGHMCMDVDECTQNKGTVGMCDQVCINVPGAYQCWCHKGFTLSSINPRSCVDINECESSVCSHNCSNTVGSFICTCPPNMKLHHDGRTCVLRSEGEGTRVGIDNNSKNIIIDGSRKIVIYGQNTSEQLSPVYGSAPLPTQIVQSSVPLRSAIQQKYGTNTEWHSANSKNQSRARDSEGTKSKSKGLMNTLPSYTSPLEVLTVARGISAVDSRDIRYKPCIPSCKNGGFCDGKRKCHCRQGFQGRYCQIDVNECSRVPSLCNYVCVNTFGSYQCLCPSGYTISGDRKSCIIHTSPVVETASINNRNKYNAVIEVLVSPNRMTADHGAHKITPTLIESSFTSEIGSLRTRLHNPAYPPNKLAIENLHTMAYSGPNLLSQVDSLFSSEQIPNEVQPTYVLYKDEETYPSSYMEPTAFLSTKVEDIVKSSEYIFGSPFTTSVTQLNSTPTLKDELGMETVPNLIVRSDVPESSISVFQQIVITPTHTGMLVTPFSTVPANITMDHSQEDLSGEKDPSKDAKKDNKGKGKKTKKLSHKDEKQKPRKDKDKKMRNKTLKKGRIKFVRLTTDFQVLNQILDASREAWRDGGTRLPVGKPRAETNWNMGTLAGGNTASGLGDRYFEVIDYDDDYFDEPLRKTYNNSDPFAVPVTVPSILSTDLTVLPRHWNLTGKPEQDCYHGDKKIKSRTTLYRDEKNCTKCICKDGELRCKPHHCPTPHCEAPLHGRCCDYCPDDCLVSDDVYHPGERFVPAVDVCRECRCVAGRAVCENIHCPALDCPEQFQVIVPEECCPVCTPPEPGCFYKGRFFYQGQLWVRKEGRCQACLCKDGAVQCNPVVCVVNCQHPQFVPGECCPLCDGCQHYNRKYNDQEMFPHPSDPCSICQCQHGNITCYPKPCNIACSHPYRPSGDCCPTCRHCYFSDRKISNGASLVINNGTCQECTCKQGNVTCKPAACAAPCMIRGKPIPSGAEFHIGSDTCTQCRCWNGTVSCHAVECETTCSHGVLLPHRCCLDCTKCDYEGQLYSEMQVFRPSGDTCKSCLCVKGIVMCQETCSSTPPKH
ncbi:uncharacterized protein [Periplaneta americana]|uniref:uncharacterized protein isoform X3 n=1 Tax=Periplaneta americana TaxID=6978 RepID=UPI0037E7CF25